MPIIPELRADAYFDHPAISSSKLKKYKLPTPAHAKWAMDNEKLDSDAILKGQVLHAMLLEPDRLDSYFVIEKEKLFDKQKLMRNGGSKELWDTMKAEAEERLVPLVSHAIYVDALGMRDSVENAAFWRHVSKYGLKEVSLFSEIDGVPVKSRLDVVYGSAVLDLKTCGKFVTDQRIESVIENLSYHLSAAMYLEVANSLGLQVDRFVWVFIESFAPYLCRFVEASPEMLKTGRQEFLACLEKHKVCTRTGLWPGYGSDEIPMVNLSSRYKSTLILNEELTDDDDTADDDGYADTSPSEFW